MANDMVEEAGGLARQVLAGTEPGRRFVGQEVFEYVCDGIRAAREPLLKRIEDLELAVAAARSRAKTAEESIEELKRRSSSAVFFEDQLVRTQAELSVTETERSKLGQRVADLEKSLVEAGNHWRCDNALADAKAEGRREAIEEVRRMIRRWEMAREQAGASEIRNVYADYLSAGDVILAAIDALAKEVWVVTKEGG